MKGGGCTSLDLVVRAKTCVTEGTRHGNILGRPDKGFSRSVGEWRLGRCWRCSHLYPQNINLCGALGNYRGANAIEEFLLVLFSKGGGVVIQGHWGGTRVNIGQNKGEGSGQSRPSLGVSIGSQGRAGWTTWDQLHNYRGSGI